MENSDNFQEVLWQTALRKFGARDQNGKIYFGPDELKKMQEAFIESAARAASKLKELYQEDFE